MKKILFLNMLFFGMFVQSQITVPPGLYKAKGINKGVELQVNGDNTFQVISFSGKLNAQNDSLYFESKYAQNSKFFVNKSEIVPNSKTIGITINSNYLNSYNNPIYIGTQKDDDSPIEYKNFNTYEEGSNVVMLPEDTSNIFFEIDRVKYIYLVDFKNNVATASKYDVSNLVSSLEIFYNPYSNFKLVGYLGGNEELFVTNEGFSIVFELNNENEERLKSAILKPVYTEKDLDFIGIPQEEDVVDDYTVKASNTDFKFNLVVDSNLKKALKTMGETPAKYLVVYSDSENINEKAEFDAFITYQENYLKNNMYYEYSSKLDLYNFYLASSKDASLVNKTTNEPKITIVNLNGDKLYETEGTLQQNQDLFAIYSQLYTSLKKSEIVLKLDKVLSDKKAPISEVRNAFYNVLEIKTPNVYPYASAVVAEVYEYTKDAMEVEKESISDSYNNTYKASDVYNEDNVKEEQNLYSLKSSKEILDIKWKQVLDYYKKQSVLDTQLVKLITEEISNNGFTIKLYNERKESLTNLDFEGIDYLFNFYNDIIQSQQQVVSDPDDDQAYSNHLNLDKILMYSFIENTSLIHDTSNYSDIEKSNLKTTLNYYRRLAFLKKDNIYLLGNYLTLHESLLEAVDDKNTFYSDYETYFNMHTKNAENFIESLDVAFSKKDVNSDWLDFKYSFSTLSNLVAWSVVENSDDLSLIKKAIHWCEASLKLEKSNAYYLDTLAQLYYKNGQKELAIKTQKEALIVMGKLKGEDLETYQSMQKTLVEMQKGTY